MKYYLKLTLKRLVVGALLGVTILLTFNLFLHISNICLPSFIKNFIAFLCGVIGVIITNFFIIKNEH